MPITQILSTLARGALMLLVSSLAVYLSLRLLGKIAKFVIMGVVVAVVIYFVFFCHRHRANLEGSGAVVS